MIDVEDALNVRTADSRRPPATTTTTLQPMRDADGDSALCRYNESADTAPPHLYSTPASSDAAALNARRRLNERARTAQQPSFRLFSRLVSTAAEGSMHDRAVDPCGRQRPAPVQRHAEVNLSLTAVLDTGEHGGGHQRPQRTLDGRESAV